MAHHHGLFRLWTAELSPFWLSKGFERSSASSLPKLPASFGDPQQPWLTLRLRDEVPAGLSLEQEFEFFKETQRESSERLLRQARALKILAAVIAVLAAITAGGIIWYVLRRLPGLKPRKP